MALPQEGIAAAGIAAAEQRLAELGRCWREEAIRAGMEAEVAEQVGSCMMDGISYRSVRGKRSCCPPVPVLCRMLYTSAARALCTAR